MSPRRPEREKKETLEEVTKEERKDNLEMFQPGGIPCAADTMQEEGEDEEDKGDKEEDEEEEEEDEAAIEGEHPGSRATVG